MSKKFSLKFWRIAGLATGIICSSGAYAMSLAQAYAKALDQDPSIRASRAALNSGKERLPQAYSQLLPAVQANFSRSKNNLDTTSPNFLGEENTTNNKYYSYSKALSIRQSIYNRARSLNHLQAQDLVNEAEAMHERNLSDLVVRLGSAYADVLLAQNQVSFMNKQRQLDQIFLNAAKTGFESGSGTRTDIDEAKARLDMTLARELEAQQQLNFSRRQLEVLTNEPISTLTDFDKIKNEVLHNELPPVEVLIEQAKQLNADAKISKARVAAAEKEAGKAQAGHLPTLDANVQWSDTGNENSTRLNTRYVNTAIGFQLTIPIFQGGAIQSQARQSQFELSRAQEIMEGTMRDLSLRIHKEYRGVTEGKLKVQAFEQAVHSANQLLISSKRSREGGFRSMLDVLNVEQQLAGAERDLTQTKYQALIARLRLYALMGKEPEAIINEIASAFVR